MRRRIEERFTLCSATQVARALGVSKRTLERMILDGRVPRPSHIRENGYRYWTLPELEQIKQQLAEATVTARRLPPRSERLSRQRISGEFR